MTVPQQIDVGQVVEGQTFTETFTANAGRTEPAISSLQADFPLCEADFLRLKHGAPKTLAWSQAIFLAGVGVGFTILGKYIERVIDNTKTPVPQWELYGFIAAIVLAVVLYLAGLPMKNEKKKVLEDIESHFKNSPRTRHIVR